MRKNQNKKFKFNKKRTHKKNLIYSNVKKLPRFVTIGRRSNWYWFNCAKYHCDSDKILAEVLNIDLSSNDPVDKDSIEFYERAAFRNILQI